MYQSYSTGSLSSPGTTLIGGRILPIRVQVNISRNHVLAQPFFKHSQQVSVVAARNSAAPSAGGNATGMMHAQRCGWPDPKRDRLRSGPRPQTPRTNPSIEGYGHLTLQAIGPATRQGIAMRTRPDLAPIRRLEAHLRLSELAHAQRPSAHERLEQTLGSELTHVLLVSLCTASNTRNKRQIA
jgi:hypothetical protein